jgi:hypothetical protein
VHAAGAPEYELPYEGEGKLGFGMNKRKLLIIYFVGFGVRD